MAKFAVVLFCLACICLSEQAKLLKRKESYIVEIYVAVDPSALEHYKDDADPKASLTREMDYFLTQTNLAFSSFPVDIKVSVLKEGIVFLDHDIFKDDPSYQEVDGVKYVEGSAALGIWGKYLEDNNIQETTKFDHAAVFSGYDFGSPKYRGVAGTAPLGGICSNVAYSIVEYTSDWPVVSVFAHELAHNLGVQHDHIGDTTEDDWESSYIMAPSGNHEENRWYFSEQSGEMLVKHIKELDAGDRNCLLTTAPTSVIPNTGPSTRLQDPEAVCRKEYGPNYFLRNHFGPDGYNYEVHGDIMCNMVDCRTDAENGDIKSIYSDGFACGINKACNGGKCVASDSPAAAAVTDDKCVFGDQKYVLEWVWADNNVDVELKASTCADIKANYKCDENLVECCVTCAGEQAKKRSLVGQLLDELAAIEVNEKKQQARHARRSEETTSGKDCYKNIVTKRFVQYN